MNIEIVCFLKNDGKEKEIESGYYNLTRTGPNRNTRYFRYDIPQFVNIPALLQGLNAKI